MFKTILACVDGSKYAEAVSSAAIWFGKSLGCRLRAISVADMRLLEGPWLADLSGVAGLQAFQALAPQLKEFNAQRALAAAEAVAQSARKEGVECSVEAPAGLLVNEILAAERAAEMVVLGQRGEGFETTGEWLGSTVERVVRKSVKPCLVTPQTFRPVRSIVAAYDGSLHANRALYTAFELSKSLKVSLTILTVEGSDDEREKSRVLKEGLDLATSQGITATALAMHGAPEEKIMEAASKRNFDLIVMGAYGHTRLRELVLGSVTTGVIRKSTVPVLLTR